MFLRFPRQRAITLGAIALLLSGCGPDTSHYTGRWRAITHRMEFPGVFVFEKQGDTFKMHDLDKPEPSMKFVYDKERQALFTPKERYAMVARYDDSTKHLVIKPTDYDGMGPKSITFERVQP